MNGEVRDILRSLPSVSTLLEHDEVRDWLNGLPRRCVVQAVQAALDQARSDILEGRLVRPMDTEQLIARAEGHLVAQSIPSLRPVINATGVVLHTGLGRAPLCDAAIEAIVEGASGYCNLEVDLGTGERGRRQDHVRELLCSLTGAESATVVNNNAAATLLILHTRAAGREVVVSRGQLIEIGGSFRLPDIMQAGGTTLREVGTTNRTRISDYEKAINEKTAMLMRVHTSNYRIVGFTEQVAIKELAALAHRFNVPVLDDLGSGVLLDPFDEGVSETAAGEPTPAASLRDGADLVCFSGDKLLGGPQSGIILGRRPLIEQLEASPLMRTYRVDKLTLLALEATLRLFLDPDHACDQIPVLAMLRKSTDQLARLANELAEKLQKALPREHFYVGSDVAYVGGGALPQHELPTVIIQWKPATLSADAAAAALRQAETPVVVRIRDDAVCFDLRTIRPTDFDGLVDSVYATAHAEITEEDDSTEDRSLPIL